MKKFLLLITFLFYTSCLYCETKNTLFAIPFYSTETSLGASAVDILYFKQKNQNYYSSLNTFAMYTLKKQFTVGAIPSVYFNGDNYLFEGRINFVNFEKKYFGIGNNTSENSEEKFTNRTYGFGISLSKKIFKNFMFGIQYSFDDMTIQNTDDYGILRFNETEGIISGIGAKIKYDTRNTNIFTTDGFLLNISYILYSSKLSSDYNYSSTSFDFRNYFEFYKKKIIFSYQLYGEFINGYAPVQKLPGLGGQNIMRGFYSGRYIDNIMLVAQPELKIKITNVVYLVLFAGIGNVYNTAEKIDIGKVKFSAGSGVRIKIRNNPRINFRIDSAFSNESSGIYLGILEAF